MKKIISAIITVIMLISCILLPISAGAVFTEMNAKGIIATDSDNLRMRSGPGTSYEIVDSIPKGSFVNILGKDQDSDKNDWYKITYSGNTGFVMAKYVQIRPDESQTDADFEKQISEFPESYKDGLRQLHSLHPAWIFTPLKTNISWKTLMEKECVMGRSLIQSPDAWKSYEKGAYNWADGTWYAFDSGGWVPACNEAVAYYLDPRNFFDGNIYQFLVLSDDGSDVSAVTIDAMLKGTFMHSSQGIHEDTLNYAEIIVKAAKEAGASPYMLAARALLEQGSKGNRLAHGTVEDYEGYYNHFDIGAYAHDGRSAILNGAIYSKGKGWNSIYKAVLGGAQFLVKSYIAVGQNTLYLQKYDVVDGGNGFYTHQYMTNISAAVSECASLRSGISGTAAENSALNFLIPVYDNMPDVPQKKPSTSGSANNILSSLSVTDHEFTVPFDKYVQEYEMFIKDSQITVNAKAYDSKATVTGTGVHNLKEGTNQIDITVTATNGNKRVYTLYVNSTCEGGTIVDGDKKFASPYINSEKAVKGVPQKLKVDAFINSITLSGYSMKITDGAGTEKSGSAYICTGDKVELYYEGKLEKSMFISVVGDINGDGVIDAADLLVMKKDILRIKSISKDADFSAADMNSDGYINVADLLLCKKRILGL